MKSLSLKVMTLLMAALVLSASGCFNENEMSSPEGTVKGYYRAINQLNFKKMLTYVDPREMTEEDIKGASKLTSLTWAMETWGISELKNQFTDVKTTLVTKKESVVWKGDKWRRVKNEYATVEFSYKIKGENIQETAKLVLLDNKWYIINWEEL